MKDLLQECAKMMHMIPNFWLWLIVAFLMGVLTSGLTHYIKEKRKENERYSNKEQEIPRI